MNYEAQQYNAELTEIFTQYDNGLIDAETLENEILRIRTFAIRCDELEHFNIALDNNKVQ